MRGKRVKMAETALSADPLVCTSKIQRINNYSQNQVFMYGFRTCLPLINVLFAYRLL